MRWLAGFLPSTVQLQPTSDAQKKTSNKDANNFTCLVDIQAKRCSFPGLLELSCACISCFIGCCFFYISTPTKQTKRNNKNTLVFPSSPFTPSVFITSVGLLPSTLYNCGLGSPADGSRGGPTIGLGRPFLAGDFWLPYFLSGGMLGGGRLTSHVSHHNLTTKCQMNTIQMSKYPN